MALSTSDYVQILGGCIMNRSFIKKICIRCVLAILLFSIALTGCKSSISEPKSINNEQKNEITMETFSPEQIEKVLNEARKEYPPDVATGILKGDISVPQEVDQCLIAHLGEKQLKEIRSGAREPSGREKDITAACLALLGVQPNYVCGVSMIDSKYPVAPGKLSGWFVSGQEADIMLSGIDFNNSGGSLLFNHPKGIATDGTHLLLADGNNNRVLIWNSLPIANRPPDIVLGQTDFNGNYPGRGRNQMNWPASVATDGKRIVVADTNNDRILIWNEFPTKNSEPADIVLDGRNGFEFGTPNKKGFAWPWGVWTNGEKLVVSSTLGGYVYIWNSFPTRDNQPADLYLTGGGNMGTPRTITSDGRCLIIGDHNAKNTVSNIGNFVWKSFPTTDDQPYDYFLLDPLDSLGAWMTGDFTRDGKLLMLGSTLHVWNNVPQAADDPPAVSVSGFKFDGGDGASLAVAGERVYISLYNGNRVVVYNSIPSDPGKKPDFAIGSPDIYTNTLDTNHFITNGIPATNGKSLFVSSDFDRKLYVWKQVPDKGGAYPDLEYTLPDAPWDNALHDGRLVLAGKHTVLVWNEPPVNGQMPDLILRDRVGGVDFKDLVGVALDNHYFYLSDAGANKIYVWEDIPKEDEVPLFSIPVEGPGRLSSDGNYLVVTSTNNHLVHIFRVADLSSKAKPVSSIGGPGIFNLPQNAIVSHGSLFVADTGFHRVHIWRDVSKALRGEQADVILGKSGDKTPMPIRDGFFNPSGLAFDGSYLWVGEFKFSFRLLRFSVK